jgi:ankyrin repeat protein
MSVDWMAVYQHTKVNPGTFVAYLEGQKLSKTDLSTAVDGNTNTLLHAASEYGDTAACIWLHEQGVELCGNRQGFTPLHEAALHGHIEVVKLLAEWYPKCVNMTTDSGWSPLDAALSKDHEEVVMMLLRCGARLSLVCKDNIGKITAAHREMAVGEERGGEDQKCVIQ